MMPENKMDSSVDEFREFIKEHPKLRQEVKDGKYTWKELYQEWYLLGEDNEQWHPYKKNTDEISNKETKAVEVKEVENRENSKPDKEDADKSDLIALLMNYMKNMDINQLQKYIANANQALAAIQSLLTSLKGGEGASQEHVRPEPVKSDPFVFRKD
ncbi:YlbD family protein [Peribacillus sp. SCS-155]|uniref:YlbD family protein n=1 Tax=Peribacillus sedimenti TaxID=3115297 RepID=UPI0039058A03